MNHVFVSVEPRKYCQDQRNAVSIPRSQEQQVQRDCYTKIEHNRMQCGNICKREDGKRKASKLITFDDDEPLVFASCCFHGLVMDMSQQESCMCENLSHGALAFGQLIFHDIGHFL